MSMINPVPTRIEDILNAPTQYAIPNYQRDFKWGETEARELVEDLDSYSGIEDASLFLGSFILEPARDQKTFIIDGQQRLTSLMLLLIACRMRARDLEAPALVSAIQAKLTFIDSATAETLGCRFIASDSVRDLFEHMAGGGWQGDFPARLGRRPVKKQANRLRPLYDFFLDHVSSLSQVQLGQFLRALYNAYVVRIAIASDEEALSVFERTNARGMDLEVADLLKNFLFARRVEGIEDKWREILANADGTILRMLKYFFVSRLGYVQKPQLYRRLKEHGNAVGPEALTASLAEFARFYSLTKNPTVDRTREYFESIEMPAISGNQDRYVAVAAALQALQEFGIAQFVPLAYAGIDLAKRSIVASDDACAKALIRLLSALEKYHFVNNAICERVGNEVERLYADTCQMWATETDLPPAVDLVINRLKEKRARIDEFKGRFAEVAYAPDSIALICYIFDRLNNHGLQPAQRLPIYVPNPRQLRRSNNIEHFMPQTLPAGLAIDDATRESLDSIGNLLPLYFRTNSRLGNLPPAEKVSRLTGSLRNEIQNLPFVQDFLDRYGRQAGAWNAQLIAARAADLAEEAYQRVWAL